MTKKLAWYENGTLMTRDVEPADFHRITAGELPLDLDWPGLAVPPMFVPQALYDDAVAAGIDITKLAPVPIIPPTEEHHV